MIRGCISVYLEESSQLHDIQLLTPCPHRTARWFLIRSLLAACVGSRETVHHAVHEYDL